MQHSDLEDVVGSQNSLICILTSADISFQREERFDEYRNGISSALEYLPGLQVEFLETRRYRNSILESLGVVNYSHTHLPLIRNKGVLWVLALRWYLKSLRKINSPVTHLVIMTGRYSLKSKHFINQISIGMESDFIGKKLGSGNQVNTGLFFISRSLLDEWIGSFSYLKSEIYSISVETSLMRFLTMKKQSGSEVIFLEKMDLFMPIFGKGKRELRIE
jgi:hypothetical protein